MEFADQYMQIMRGVYSEHTWPVVYRRYKRQAREINEFRDQKKISSSSPQKMTEEDVLFFLSYRKAKKLSHSEMAKEIAAMNHLFQFCGNPAVSVVLSKNPLLRSKGFKDPRLPPLEDDVRKDLISRLDQVPDDWSHLRAYALVALCISTGVRPVEVRYADVNDIYTDTWDLDIRRPKGVDTYGEPRTVPIPPYAKSILTRYLKARSIFMKEHLDIDTKALFPSYQSDDGYMSYNGLRQVRLLVESEIGVEFDFRTCRRTCGQYLADRLEIEDVSVNLGHSSTRTTERYYGRRSKKISSARVSALYEEEFDSQTSEKSIQKGKESSAPDGI